MLNNRATMAPFNEKQQHFKTAAVSHKGTKRKANEDSYLVDEPMGLWIVADGMGGHAHGKTASQMACNLIKKALVAGHSIPQAVNMAHKSIQTLATSLGAAHGMGTTIIIVSLDAKNRGNVWWLGDSRIYLHTNKELALLTHDHSKVQELLDKELITADEAIKHKEKHIITRALGMPTTKTVELDHKTIKLEDGAKLLLCSDGLSNELNNEQILTALNSKTNLKTQAEELVTQANLCGGRDNITVVLLQNFLTNS